MNYDEESVRGSRCTDEALLQPGILGHSTDGLPHTKVSQDILR